MDGPGEISLIVQCLLEAAGPLSASQIAQKTGISTLDVNRLIRDAQDFGAPISKYNDKNEHGNPITVFMLKLDAASTKPEWHVLKQLLSEAQTQQKGTKGSNLAPDQTVSGVEETRTTPGGPPSETEVPSKKDLDTEKKLSEAVTPGASAEASNPIKFESAKSGADQASTAPGGPLSKTRRRRAKHYPGEVDIVELIEIIQGNNAVAADKANRKLQDRFEPMIRNMATSYESREQDDISQIARIALFQAAKTFDVYRGFRFRAHAEFCIRDAIRQYFRAFGKPIHLSERMQRTISKIKAVTYKFERDGKLYSVEDIATVSGLTIKQVQQGLKIIERGDASSLDSSVSDDDVPVPQEIPCPESDQPEFQAEEKDRLEHLKRLCVKVLNERQRDVVYHYLGITEDKIPKAFVEIARLMHRDPDSVGEMYKRAEAKLIAWFKEHKSDRFNF